jgi:precorrin-6B C5,15-methyltransferase / cobalt-precorrin-6B C5,C15-methyltransferase
VLFFGVQKVSNEVKEKCLLMSDGSDEKMEKVYIVGMGMSAVDLTDSQLEVIRSAHILVGGRRHLESFSKLAMDKKAITGRVEETLDFIETHRADHRIVVLSSGDPLFYGIGARIVHALGPDQVTVLPNISSIAAAFARIRAPWSNAGIVSLHGRENRYKLLDALKSRNPVGVLTDGEHSPQWLAQWLITKGIDYMEMAVFEKMGMPEEAFGWYHPDQAIGQSFAQPNVVVLRPMDNTPCVEPLMLGMTENAYCHEGGLITKSEVRAVTLSKLHLMPGQTLWDLGAGSGSVGIEASVLLGHGRIIAVEQNAGRVDHIQQNARRYNVYNLDAVQAELPAGLETLPPPDRIFIGGGGRDLAVIVRSAIGFLKSGGRVVVNTILMDNLTRVLDVLKAEGLAANAVQIQVCRGKEMPWSCRFEAGSPVWIVAAEKI